MNSTNNNANANANDQYRPGDHAGLLHVDDGVLIYDRENPDAWIQSDSAVAILEQT